MIILLNTNLPVFINFTTLMPLAAWVSYFMSTVIAPAGLMPVPPASGNTMFLILLVNEWEMYAISASHTLPVVHYYNAVNLPAPQTPHCNS